MPAELHKKLPLKREVNHRIELMPNAELLVKASYWLSLLKLLDARFIRPFTSFGAPVLFQKNHDGSMRLYIDYRTLNKITVKNKYSIPLIMYHQVRIAKGDEPSTTCVTRHGSYEFLVMPIRLTNARATFCTVMIKVLQPFLDYFMVIYLEDIVVYGKLLGEYVKHLREVFQTLQENECYVKEDKCLFAQRDVPFLGHIVKGGKT
ncbi:reverse transcriptase [Gossypium australe]|uniref:Reverse transcriptase n=1 Tax=Gossypium australe TaxID=47621 RepID=A0A5B6W7K3_9ROSI|nr:reverse transcriptase [Gossypium australe]